MRGTLGAMRRSMNRTTLRSRAALARVNSRTITRYRKAGVRAPRGRVRYDLDMRPSALVMVLVGLCASARAAHADTFGGFSAVDRPYLVNQDRACTPVLVADGTARGVPACTKAAADVLAHLDIKPGERQSGGTAVFVAAASGSTLVVSNASGDKIVAWDAPNPIGKVVELYATHDEDRIAVVYTVRRAGRELTEVVAFDLIAHGDRPVAGKIVDPHTVAPPAPPPAQAPVDPAVAKAVAVAQKAAKPKAAAAWQAVIALDPDHSEAHYALAALAATANKPADAIAELELLAKSARPDAIELLVDARFNPAFAALRADAKFRAAVGLDRKSATAYERFMGLGGQWEQVGTACDKATVHLVALRDPRSSCGSRPRARARSSICRSMECGARPIPA